MPTTDQSIVVKAPINAVWEKLTDFHDFSWAPNVVTDVVIVGEKNGTAIGAKRLLNGAFHETLIEVNPHSHLVRYSIDDGPSPVSKDEVSNFVGVIQLSQPPGQDGTRVTWTSSWDSNSQDAVEFCKGIYVALLGELAASFE